MTLPWCRELHAHATSRLLGVDAARGAVSAAALPACVIFMWLATRAQRQMLGRGATAQQHLLPQQRDRVV